MAWETKLLVNRNSILEKVCKPLVVSNRVDKAFSKLPLFFPKHHVNCLGNRLSPCCLSETDGRPQFIPVKLWKVLCTSPPGADHKRQFRRPMSRGSHSPAYLHN